MVRMDLRVVTISVEKQEGMMLQRAGDGRCGCLFPRGRLGSARREAENFLKATSPTSQTTLRSVLGQAPLDDLLSQRESINQKLQEIIRIQNRTVGRQSHGSRGEGRGVARHHETRDGQAGRSRERRAKIVNAEGEFQAAEKLRKPQR